MASLPADSKLIPVTGTPADALAKVVTKVLQNSLTETWYSQWFRQCSHCGSSYEGPSCPIHHVWNGNV